MAYNPSNPNGQAPSISSAPVVIASDQTAVNTTIQESIAGGASIKYIVSVATSGGTNITQVKSGQGKVTGWYIYNSVGTPRKVSFYNTATAPTLPTTATFSIIIPPLSAANCPFPAGIDFSAGIYVSTTTNLDDTTATGVGANDLIINIFYK